MQYAGSSGRPFIYYTDWPLASAPGTPIKVPITYGINNKIYYIGAAGQYYGLAWVKLP